MKSKRRNEIHQSVKIGTMPRNVVWVTATKGGFEVGQMVEWRETLWDKRQEGRIWQIGPAPENMLYLEL